MLYNYMQILLHRPYTSRANQPTPAQGPGYTHARLVCLDSATSISKLLQLFERQPSLRNTNVHIIHFIFSAALIMVYAMASSPATHETDGDSSEGASVRKRVATHLSTCFRALDETSRSFDRARHVSESLVAIRSRWDRQRRYGLSTKRNKEPDRLDDPRKRRLTGLERPPQSSSGSSGTFARF